MKKLLIIAIAAAVSAPVLADTKLYGILEASYDALDADGGTSKNTVSSNSSRIGVKGSSDLNNDLKVIYQAEWGIDTGGKDSAKDLVFSNRNQVVGIAGGFGAVLIGRHDTPMKTVGRKADLFWSTQLGNNYKMTNHKTWDLRPNNVLAYQTPKMGGFQALAAYVTDLAGSDDNTAFSVNGFYNAGPIQVGAAFETHDIEGSSDIDAVRLMGAYKVGPAKLVGFYQDETNGAAADASVFGIGAAYKVGAGTVKAQYYSRDIDKTDNDPDLIAVGYDHKLGKKTTVFAQYATASEGATLGGAGHGEAISSPTGGDADGFSVGVRHKF